MLFEKPLRPALTPLCPKRDRARVRPIPTPGLLWEVPTA